MKIIKNTFSTVLSDLYGRDKYQSHIEEGREYWYYFAENTQAYKLTHKYWNKLKITYVRSGCLFYTLSDVPEFKEEFCPVGCFMSSMFEFAEIDPVKDLSDVWDGSGMAAKQIINRFDDTRTIVKNWPNEKEVEIDENELYEKYSPEDYLFIKAMAKTK